MGMAKIPEGTSWEKITWQRKTKKQNQKQNQKKKTKKKKKQRNEMTISKDNKNKNKNLEVIIWLLKLKGNRIVFIGDLEHSNPLLNSKTKT